MFSITEQTATLAHINVRTERHGEEPAGAADLKIQFTAGNGVLSEFHPRLRHALYKAEENPAQGSVDGVKPEPTVRVFGDLIEKIRLKHELVGAKVLIDFGLGGVNFATNSPYAPTIHVGAYRTDLCIWTGSSYRDQREIEIEPTHWMPRPAFPDCAAPGVSTVEDAQDERQADACPRCEGSGGITVMSDNSPDAHDVVVCCDHCQGSGAAVDAAKYLAAALAGEKYRHMQVLAEYRNFHRSLCARFGYGHDEVHFRRDLVSLEEAIAAKVAAPAAGDALDAARYRFLLEKSTVSMGYASLCAFSAHNRDTDFFSREEGLQALESAIDAAIAAQRKGDA